LAARIEKVLTFLECRPDCELSLVLCGDDWIAELNEQYLGRKGPTNVLAFALAEGEDAQVAGPLLGDVVVSLPYADREAAENGLDCKEHAFRLIVHGILHLLGHDHLADEEQARRMEELTERLLEQSRLTPGGYTHGPIER
jgi:probable rRNA maturation factor